MIFVFLKSTLLLSKQRSKQGSRMEMARRAVTTGVLVALWSSFCGLAKGDERTQRYKPGEQVILWANKVGPYENPQETYSYYTMPYCKVDPDKLVTRWAGIYNYYFYIFLCYTISKLNCNAEQYNTIRSSIDAKHTT
jgi:hypothetical protein